MSKASTIPSSSDDEISLSGDRMTKTMFVTPWKLSMVFNAANASSFLVSPGKRYWSVSISFPNRIAVIVWSWAKNDRWQPSPSPSREKHWAKKKSSGVPSVSIPKLRRRPRLTQARLQESDRLRRHATLSAWFPVALVLQEKHSRRSEASMCHERRSGEHAAGQWQEHVEFIAQHRRHGNARLSLRLLTSCGHCANGREWGKRTVRLGYYPQASARRCLWLRGQGHCGEAASRHESRRQSSRAEVDRKQRDRSKKERPEQFVSKLATVIPETFANEVKDDISVVLHCERHIQVPRYLHSFVLRHLDAFIEKSKRAVIWTHVWRSSTTRSAKSIFSGVAWRKCVDKRSRSFRARAGLPNWLGNTPWKERRGSEYSSTGWGQTASKTSLSIGAIMTNSIFQLKEFRDNPEVHRMQSLKSRYEYHTAVEESCLNKLDEFSCRALESAQSAENITHANKMPTPMKWLTSLCSTNGRCDSMKKHRSLNNAREAAATMIDVPSLTQWSCFFDHIRWTTSKWPRNGFERHSRVDLSSRTREVPWSRCGSLWWHRCHPAAHNASNPRQIPL